MRVLAPAVVALDALSRATLLSHFVTQGSEDDKGAVAQLGERMTGSHEVRGSIPLGSIN
jgi:hypothetical protein